MEQFAKLSTGNRRVSSNLTLSAKKFKVQGLKFKVVPEETFLIGIWILFIESCQH